MLTRLLTIGILTAMVFAGSLRADPPPIFQKMTLDEAIQAAGDGEILVVKATAKWCGPCKRMDRTTWRDDRVVAWFNDNGFKAVQIDVDVQRDDAKRLKVKAMPTMVAFRDGQEVDRIRGFRDSDGLLAWCSDVKAGRRAVDALQDQAAIKPGERVDVQAKLQLARGLHGAGQHQESLAEYEWLWDNMLTHAPSMRGVRVSFMRGDIMRLIADFPDAKEPFIRRRDEITGQLNELRAPPAALVGDWLTLNEIVGDEAATLQWIEEGLEDNHRKAVVQRFSHKFDDILIERKMWDALAAAEPDPTAVAEKELRMLKPAVLGRLQQDKRAEDAFRSRIYKDVAARYAAYIFTDQSRKAQILINVVFKLAADDDSNAVLSVFEEAVSLGAPSRDMFEMLDKLRMSDEPDVDRIDRLHDDIKRTLTPTA